MIKLELRQRRNNRLLGDNMIDSPKAKKWYTKSKVSTWHTQWGQGQIKASCKMD